MENNSSSRLVSFIRKYSTIFFSICIYLFIVLAYADMGIRRDGDSDSYLHLIKGYDVFPNFMRPIVYPAILFVFSGIAPMYSDQLLFFFQAVLLTCTLLLVFRMIHFLFDNRFLAYSFTLFCLLNLNITRYVNYMNPEIVMTAILTGISYLYLRIQKNILYGVCAIFLLSVGVFTKPILLYYPPIFIALYVLLYSNYDFVRKRIALIFISTFIFLVVPVGLWTYGNKLNHGYYSFSEIRQINSLGKLIAYNMVYAGPDEINFNGVPIKEFIRKHLSDNPYDIEESILNETPEAITEQNKFYLAYYGYIDATVIKNILPFVYRSILFIPRLLHHDEHIEEDCAPMPHPPIYISTISCTVRFWVGIIYNFYNPYVAFALPMLLYIGYINAIIHLYRIAQKKALKHSKGFIMIFSLVAYYLFAASMGTYDYQISRILSPIYIQMTIVCVMSVYDFWLLIRNGHVITNRILRRRSV